MSAVRDLGLRGMALLVLSACDGGAGKGAFGTLVRGDAWTCLQTDDVDAVLGEETASYDVSGTVVSEEAAAGPEGNLLACGGATSRVLTIAATDFSTWTMGYGILDEVGADQTPALDVSVGAQVYLHFNAVNSFGTAGGFVLQDTTSVIAAMDVGSWGSALEIDDVPGLVVADGEKIAAEETDCGLLTGRSLLFQGDADTELSPMGSRLITFSGKAFTAFAVANTSYEDEVDCTDVAGERTWAVFR